MLWPDLLGPLPPWPRQTTTKNSAYLAACQCSKNGWVDDARLPIRGRPVLLGVPSQNSKRGKSSNLKFPTRNAQIPVAGQQEPPRPDVLRRLQRAIPTAGANPVRSFSRRLACGSARKVRGHSDGVRTPNTVRQERRAMRLSQDDCDSVVRVVVRLFRASRRSHDDSWTSQSRPASVIRNFWFLLCGLSGMVNSTRSRFRK